MFKTNRKGDFSKQNIIQFIDIASQEQILAQILQDLGFLQDHLSSCEI